MSSLLLLLPSVFFHLLFCSSVWFWFSPLLLYSTLLTGLLSPLFRHSPLTVSSNPLHWVSISLLFPFPHIICFTFFPLSVLIHFSQSFICFLGYSIFDFFLFLFYPHLAFWLVVSPSLCVGSSLKSLLSHRVTVCLCFVHRIAWMQ